MNWLFCPMCETELDNATKICPACLYDGNPTEPEAEPEPQLSLTERYRGTMFAADIIPSLAVHGISRSRRFVVVGLLMMLALYAGMVIYIGAPR